MRGYIACATENRYTLFGWIFIITGFTSLACIGVFLPCVVTTLIGVTLLGATGLGRDTYCRYKNTKKHLEENGEDWVKSNPRTLQFPCDRAGDRAAFKEYRRLRNKA